MKHTLLVAVFLACHFSFLVANAAEPVSPVPMKIIYGVNFVILRGKYRTYITHRDDSTLARIETFDETTGNILVYYQAQYSDVKVVPGGILIDAFNSILWGPESSNWMPDSFSINTDRNTVNTVDETLSLQEAGKLIAQELQNKEDKEVLNRLRSGIMSENCKK